MRDHVTEQGSWIRLGAAGHRLYSICEHGRQTIGMVLHVDR
jgi:hypothetical protein